MQNKLLGIIKLWIIILFLIISIPIFGVIFISYELLSIQNPGNLPILKPLIWKSDEGICLSSNGGKSFEIYTLKDQHGNPINNPPFIFRNDDLIYWSPADCALRIIPTNGHSSWKSLKESLPPKWRTYSIQSCRDGIVINGCANESNSESFVFKLSNANTKIIPGAIEAKSKYPSQNIAVLNSLHQMILQDQELQKMILSSDISIEHWDYDPMSSTICIADNTHIMVFNDNSSSNWKVPWFCWIRDVEIKCKSHQIWVSVGLPYSVRQLLLVYSNNGKFLGNRLGFPTPICSPFMEINSKMIDLLDNMRSEK